VAKIFANDSEQKQRERITTVKADVDTTRKKASARTQRYRARQKDGLKIALTPFSDDIVGLLIDLNYLPVADSENPRRVGVAIFEILRDSAANEKKRRG